MFDQASNREKRFQQSIVFTSNHQGWSHNRQIRPLLDSFHAGITRVPLDSLHVGQGWLYTPVTNYCTI